MMRYILFVLCLCALTLSVQHFFSPVDTSPANGLPGYKRPGGPFLGSLPDHSLNKLSNEDPLDYIRRLTQTVHYSTYHCAPETFEPSWLIKVLFSSSRTAQFARNGVLVERYFQCGFCHQRAYLLYRILRKNGIAAEVLNVDGHVVTRVTVDGQPYLTDPDYGVGPFPWDSDPESLEQIIVANYGPSPIGSLDVLIPIFTETSTDLTSHEGLDQLFLQQRKMFDTAQTVAWALLLFAVVVICLPGMLYRIPR